MSNQTTGDFATSVMTISALETSLITEAITTSSSWTLLVSNKDAIVMSVFLNVIALLGIVGNSLVIVAVMFCRKLQTITNVFVIALAVTDLLVCVTLPFQTLALCDPAGWLPDHWLCAALGAITSICFGASVLLLVFIAIHRFCVITRPRQSINPFSKSRYIAVMVIAAYLYTIVMFAVLPIAGIGELGYARMYRICAWNESHELSEVNDYIVALTFGVSFCVIVYCYVRIFLFVRRHHRTMFTSKSAMGRGVDQDYSTENTETQLQTHQSYVSNSNNMNNAITKGKTTSGIKKAVSRREVEITKNLFFVIVSFFICIIPYSISLSLSEGVASLSIFSGILLMLNVMINPIIYSFKHPTFKVVLRNLMCCRYAAIPKPTPLLKRLLKPRNEIC